MGTFRKRDTEYPNRRKIQIISQTPNEIVANIFRDEGEIYDEGTPINVDTMNRLEDAIAGQGTTIKINEEMTALVEFREEPQVQIDLKVDKVTSAVSGNIASFGIEGNIQDSGLNAEKTQQVELVYFRGSTDDNINCGKTSGIGGGESINKDFSKYSKLIIYAKGWDTQIVYEMNLSHITDYQYEHVWYYTEYRASGVAQGFIDKTEHYMSQSSVDVGKTTFTHVKIGYFNMGSSIFNDRSSHEDYPEYRIDKIEGVY